MYIDNNLDPKIKNFCNNLSIQENLASTEIMIIISHISRETWNSSEKSTDSWFVDSYNPVLLKAWEAKISIQSVRNHYKALKYMMAFLQDLKVKFQSH